MSRILGLDPDTRSLGIAVLEGERMRGHEHRLRPDPVNRLADAYEAAQLYVGNRTVVIPEHPAGKWVPRELWEILGAFKAGCTSAAWVHPGMPPGTWKLASVGKGNASKEEVSFWVADTYGIHHASQNVLDAVAITHAGAAWWASRKETAA